MNKKKNSNYKRQNKSSLRTQTWFISNVKLGHGYRKHIWQFRPNWNYMKKQEHREENQEEKKRSKGHEKRLRQSHIYP